MKIKQFLFVSLAVAFSLIAAFMTHARTATLTAYGKNNQNNCVSAQVIESNCNQMLSSGIQCTVSISEDARPAFKNSNCTQALYRPN